MALLPAHEWRAAEALAAIPFTNPFRPERVELERKAIGAGYVGVGPVLVLLPGKSGEDMYPELPALRERTEGLVALLRERLDTGQDATPAELEVYEGLALVQLYLRFTAKFTPLVSGPAAANVRGATVRFWAEFAAEFERLFRLEGRGTPFNHKPEVIFAWFFQVERAFTHIFEKIVGGSRPAARLREAVWESIFSRDMRRYLRVLHRRMSDLPTLILGPSGSGKELVASAIGMSCFIPFNPNPEERKFAAGKADLYIPLNLAALTPTLIESELFGHAKGAFSGAASERKGWLEKCDSYGAVFLDEIGELDGSIQVKLLRVLETRHFEKVGSTETLDFVGKLIAATNRDLAAEMQAGRFRHDLYYRLCADQVTTPSLDEQLSDRPEELKDLVRFIARRILDPSPGASDEAEEAERLTEEVVAWIRRRLDGYPWPGNFRELGQCVRNVMVRGHYLPPSRGGDRADQLGTVEELLTRVREAPATRDELLSRYYALILYLSDGNYREAGRRLKVDWKTVRGRHDRAFYDRLKRPPDPERP
jgi:DNA-binding NtrC family response regulator